MTNGGSINRSPSPDQIFTAELQRHFQEHGITEKAARTVIRLGEALRVRTLRSGVEFAAMVDAGTGTRVGRIIGGTSHQVDIGLHLDVLKPDRLYVHLHTHPASSSFSDLDASSL